MAERSNLDDRINPNNRNNSKRKSEEETACFKKRLKSENSVTENDALIRNGWRKEDMMKIKKKFGDLTGDMLWKDILDHLIADECMSEEDREIIANFPTLNEQNQMFLLKLLQKKDGTPYKSFTKALEATGQDWFAKMLANIHLSIDEPFGENIDEATAKSRLETHHQFLLDELLPSKFLPILLEKEAIDLDDYEDILVERTRKKKSKLLLQTILQTSNLLRAYHALEYALKKTDSSYIVDKLRSPIVPSSNPGTPVEVKVTNAQFTNPESLDGEIVLLGIRIQSPSGNLQSFLQYLQDDTNVHPKLLFARNMSAVQLGAQDGSIVIKLRLLDVDSARKLSCLDNKQHVCDMLKKFVEDPVILEKLEPGTMKLKLTVNCEKDTNGEKNRWKMSLIDNYDFIIDELDVKEIGKCNEVVEVIGKEYFDHLFSVHNQRKHLAITFADKLLHEGREVYDTFLRCLQNTDQDHIYQKLDATTAPTSREPGGATSKLQPAQPIYMADVEIDIHSKKSITEPTELTSPSTVARSSSEDDENIDSDYASGEEGSNVGKPETKTHISPLLKLRKYQLELAETAIQGENTIICSATGSGKTWVALHIVNEHLRDVEPGSRKVVFMARQTTLIQQQYERLRKYLDHKVVLITGGTDMSLNLEQVLPYNDIICLTPKILVNNLLSGQVKSLNVFSLMILDECHHTKKDEPYNELMRKYMELKFSKEATKLPQIVGLTASIGVGQSMTEAEAVEYIIGICANLDVRKMSTVTRNDEEMKRFVNVAEEETEKLKPRADSQCKKILISTMEEIEKVLREGTLFERYLIPVINQIPSGKDTQEYMAWTRKLMEIASRASKPQIARFVFACAKYLGIFNEALEMDSLLGINDVMKLFANRFAPEHEQQEKLSDQERDIFERVKSVQRQLSVWATDTENPNLRLLSDTLRLMLKAKGEDSRAMVFVKTRATCKALEEFLTQDLADLGIKAHALMGQASKIEEDGMTAADQNNTLKLFEAGVYKVLVATSVGSEGIDVADCNIVVSYNYYGNEITKIQMSGRSRKKGGTAVVIGDDKTMEKGRINAFKAAIMEKAVRKIQQLDPAIMTTKIEKRQRENMAEHRLRKASEEKYKLVPKPFHVLRCKACQTVAVKLTDVRKFKGSYFIVIDKAFKDRIDTKKSENLSFHDISSDSSITCKKCTNMWGRVWKYLSKQLLTLSAKSFFIENTESKDTTQLKQWKEVNIPEIGIEELAEMDL